LSKDLNTILKTYWGYDSFRPQQLAVIDAVLDNKDTLALLPTGAGKSICFQVPTIYKNGICIVISPLIALMQDQVKDLQSKNIPAIALGGNLSEEAQAEVLAAAIKGKYKFIYCSPEKLAQKVFQEALSKIKVTLFAIDEAHCISQWGYDFRPPYRKLNVIKQLFPKVPILAITASAIPIVQKDITTQLDFVNATIITDHFLRPNLEYRIQKVPVKIHTLRNLLNELNGAAIIYCNTRNNVTQLAQLLHSYGYKVAAYHAGMSMEERKKVQDNWMQNITPIVVCTSAFGMGINKGNVRMVVHYDIPGSIEQYYQEAGRAGRDGQAAAAILLYQQNDWDYWLELQEKKYPSIEIIKKIYQDLADYVQLPVGMGEKQQFVFDFENFCTIFKWDKIIARNALSWIQKEGHIRFSESAFTPSMVQVLGDRYSIENFQNENETAGAVLQTLLRTYGGILDSPHFINERLLAELLQRDPPFVVQQLQFLALVGLISFEQKQNQPVVQFLWNRTAASFMKIDFDHYQLMKKAFIERIKQFIGYLQAKPLVCRSIYLANYFGEKGPKACGICDICTNTHN
jgi:ATP-dependent DNA helicase RecQ